VPAAFETGAVRDSNQIVLRRHANAVSSLINAARWRHRLRSRRRHESGSSGSVRRKSAAKGIIRGLPEGRLQKLGWGARCALTLV